MQCVLSFATQALADIDPMELYFTPTLTLTLPAFTILPTYCNPVVQSLAVMEATSKVIDFISFDQQNGVLTITPIKPTNLDLYSLMVNASVSATLSPLNSDPSFVNSATLTIFTFNLNVVVGCSVEAIVPS